MHELIIVTETVAHFHVHVYINFMQLALHLMNTCILTILSCKHMQINNSQLLDTTSLSNECCAVLCLSACFAIMIFIYAQMGADDHEGGKKK